MFKIIFTLLLVSLSILLSGIDCSMISDQKIYRKLQSDFMCFRRFNATNQFGCQSKQGGSVGTVHIIRSDSDIDYVVKSGPNDPYIPCIRMKHFTAENIIKFRDSQRVSGVVLFDDNDTDQSYDCLPDSLTEDRRCPNEMSSYYVDNPTYGHCAKQEWNKYATIQSLYELNLDFPMILIRDHQNISNIETCFNDYNSKENKKNYEPNRSTDLLCSLQLKTWMLGAKNSKVCMARSASGYNFESLKFCDYINSFNVFSTLFKYEPNNTINDRSILVLTSRLDALSIFDNAASGASTTLTAVITLLSVMSMLRDQRDQGTLKNNGRNVLYSFFDGEAFDYIGSGRAAYDLGTDGLAPALFRGDKPSSLKLLKHHLHSAIEINQATSNDKFYIHTDPLTRDKATVKQVLDQLIGSLASSPSIENVNQTDLPLPPSSVQQLLAHDLDLPVLVISNHKTDFINPYYNSLLDDARTIKSKATVIAKIASLSESIARTLLAILEPASADKVSLKADQELIGKLYNCLIEDSRCKFFEEVRGRPSVLQPHFKTYPLYISTSGNEELQPYHYEYIYTLSRLSCYLNGRPMNNITTKEDCSAMDKIDSNVAYEWYNITVDDKTNASHEVCYESTEFLTLAVSPVFLNETPNWSMNYSTWTESVWNTANVRLFVTSSRYQEYFTFFTGLAILFVSFFISRWAAKNADILFISLDSPDSPVSM